MSRFRKPMTNCMVGFHRFMSSKPSSLPDGTRLDGRVAIVSAGTNGIGLAIAKRLAKNGAHVVVSSRKQKNVDNAVDEMKDLGYKVSGFPCHISNQEQRKELLKKTMSEHGKINILVQNAGVNPHMIGIMDTPESAIDKTYEVHIKSNFQMIQEIAPYMARSKHQGSIILTSSVTAYLSHTYPGIYAITKASVNAMTAAFKNDLIRMNIRINCLTLGGFDTDFMKQLQKIDDVIKPMVAMMATGRLGKPEECAGLAAFLASDDASYITGESFAVSGGMYTRL